MSIAFSGHGCREAPSQSQLGRPRTRVGSELRACGVRLSQGQGGVGPLLLSWVLAVGCGGGQRV